MACSGTALALVQVLVILNLADISKFCYVAICVIYEKVLYNIKNEDK
jgi:hypothetical protein